MSNTSAASVVIALVVAVLIVFSAVVSLVNPVVNAIVARVKHEHFVRSRRAQFYSELKMLMTSY